MVTGKTVGQLNVEVVEHDGLRWVNIVQPSQAEMIYLKGEFNFHPLDLDDCLSKIQLPKLDEYPNYVFLVLHFPLFDSARRLTHPSELDFFAGADFVVTVHNGALRPISKLFQDCKDTLGVRSEVMGQGSGQLLYRILDGLVDYCFPILGKIIENVELAEDRIFESRAAGATLQELATLRRDVLSFMRIVRPQIDVLQSIEGKQYTFLNLNTKIYFGDLVDHMRRVWSDLEDLKEELGALHDTFHSLATHRASEVMRAVTVAGTVALPALVVASLYGMNVNLPLQDSPAAFWVVGGVTFLATAAMLTYSRMRGWL